MSEEFDICIVGAGPAGLGFAQEWVSRFGGERILIVEAGPEIESRRCTVQELRGCRKVMPCHVTSGIGGSSGLAGGKLSEYPAGRGLSAIMGAAAPDELKESMLRLAPYIPTTPAPLEADRLKVESERYRALSYELRHYPANKYSQTDLMSAWAAISAELRAAGVEIRTDSRVVDVHQVPQGGFEVRVETDSISAIVTAKSVMLASGRAGSDLANSLGAKESSHPLDVGVRIEFPAALWPDLDAVHGDLKLHFDNARTFCTSKAGWISPYRFQDFMLLEGRTDSDKKSSWSNLAITIRTAAAPTAVIDQIRESTLRQGPGSSIRQALADYVLDTPSERESREPSASFSYWRWGDVNDLFPVEIAQELRAAVSRFSTEVMPRQAAEEAFVFGPELDYYWPTLPHRSEVPGLWAVGDVTSDYRGTLQAYAAGRYMTTEVAAFLEIAGAGR
jgi:uncharacterized FAD-dependent dehydrogenase